MRSGGTATRRGRRAETSPVGHPASRLIHTLEGEIEDMEYQLDSILSSASASPYVYRAGNEPQTEDDMPVALPGVVEEEVAAPRMHNSRLSMKDMLSRFGTGGKDSEGSESSSSEEDVEKRSGLAQEDETHYAELQVGTRVVIHSLKSDLYNGRNGQVRGYDKNGGRYTVLLDGKDGRLAGIKPCNVRPVDLKVGLHVSVCGLVDEGNKVYNGESAKIVDCNMQTDEYNVVVGDGVVLKVKARQIAAADPTKPVHKPLRPSLSASTASPNPISGLARSDKQTMSDMLLRMGQEKMEQDEFDAKMKQRETNFQTHSETMSLKLSRRETNKSRREALYRLVNVRNRALLNVVKANNSTTDMKELLSIILNSAHHVCNHDFTSIHIHQKNEGCFWSMYRKVGTRGVEHFTLYENMVGANDIIVNTVTTRDRMEWAQEQDSTVNSDVSLASIQDNIETDTYNIVSIPIEDYDHHIKAVMCFGNRRQGYDPIPFGPSDLDELEFYTAEVSNIFNERSHEIFIYIAILDHAHNDEQSEGSDSDNETEEAEVMQRWNSLTDKTNQTEVDIKMVRNINMKQHKKRRKAHVALTGESLREFLAEYNPGTPSVTVEKTYTALEKLQRVLPKIKAQTGFSFVRKKIQSWSFDPLKYTRDELTPYCKAMYDNLEMLQTEFVVDFDKCKTFINTILGKYQDVPYHNAFHAVSVAHFCHMYLWDTDAKEVLLPVERIALLTAALGHDADHPGTTNAFHAASGSELALRYNDVSVLENHHAAITSTVLTREDCNFLVTEHRKLRLHFRKILVESILATDMVHHASKTKLIRERARILTQQQQHDDEAEIEPAFDRENDKSRLLLSKVIIHSADISNPVIFDFAVVYQWATMVCEEFHAQTIKEREAGLPVTAFLEGVTEDVKKAKLQLSFYDYIVLPWYEAVAGVIPKIRLVYANIEQNRRKWQIIAKGAATAEEVLADIKKAKSLDVAAEKPKTRRRMSEGEGGHFPKPGGAARAQSLPVPDSATTAPTLLTRSCSAPAQCLFSGSREEDNDDDSRVFSITQTDDDKVCVRVLGSRETLFKVSNFSSRTIKALLSRLEVLDTEDGPSVRLLDESILAPKNLVRVSSYAGYSGLTPTVQPKSEKIMTAEKIAGSVQSNTTLAVGGFNGSAHPEELIVALAARFAKTQQPTSLKLIFGVGQGDKRGRGLDALADPLLVSSIIYSHLGTCPMLQALVRNDMIAAHNLPLGVYSHLLRCSPKPLLSACGLKTDHDPRLRGCAVNNVTLSSAPPVVELDPGTGLLRYLPLSADIAFLRGTAADEMGNISLSEEAVVADILAQAYFVHGHGGKVYFQVKRCVSSELASVDVPGCLVDGICIVSDDDLHWQTFAGKQTEAALRSRQKDTIELSSMVWPELKGWRRHVAARASEEIKRGEIVNLGLGVPERVAQVLHEKGKLAEITLSTEAGTIGGIPLSGFQFGTARFPDCVIPTATMFDMYDSGMLDVTLLGLGELDRNCVNVGKFAGRFPGVGGFANIALGATRLVAFVGRHLADGDIEGETSAKFVKQVESGTEEDQAARGPREEGPGRGRFIAIRGRHSRLR